VSVQTAIEAGRAAAEALMLDECSITRPGEGKGTWNEATGTYDPVPPTTVYSGKCKLQTGEVAVTTSDVAGRQAFIVAWRLDLPVEGTEAVRQGDTATITASALDAALVGRTFIVQSTHIGTAKTARRLPVVAEVTAQ
jgi:Family of unknown function (DUF6093)